jgi:hypothetical protein
MLFWLPQVLVGEQECAVGYGDSHEGEQVTASYAAASSWRWRSAEEFVVSLTQHNWETLLPHTIWYTLSSNGALILYSQNQTTKIRIPTFDKSKTFCRIHCTDDRALEAGGSVTGAAASAVLLREIQATNQWTKLSFRCEKLRKWLLVSSCMSVRPHGTTRLPVTGLSRNLFENFAKICRENWNLILITIQWTETCGPRLKAKWNSGERCMFCRQMRVVT